MTTTQDTGDGFILTLKLTHLWPAAAAKTAGNVADKIPGGGQAGGVLKIAGGVMDVVGVEPVEVEGSEIILEYKAGGKNLY